MSKRHQLDQRRRNLGEIREIMDAMKNFAYMETRKLARILPPRQAMVASLTEIAGEFKTHFEPGPAPLSSLITVGIVVGTERGFCGDFNHRIARSLATNNGSANHPERLLIVGHKLHHLFADDDRVIATLEGANVQEDIDGVITRLLAELDALRKQIPQLALKILYLTEEQQLADLSLLPPFTDVPGGQPKGQPPVLYLEPMAFFTHLGEQYVMAALMHTLTLSLSNENRRRVTHLEQAVQHLNNEEQSLLLRSNTLRQEEITEELEVILLSADGAMKPAPTN